MIDKILKELKSKKNAEQAKNLSRFFKTGKGQYGEGDIFWGIKVPAIRETVKKFKEASLKDIQELLNSKVHEHRLTGLLILVEKNKKAENKKEIYDFYLKNTKNINNWDLVDLTAPHIVGGFILENKKERKILYSLVKSNNLWERRISVLSTFTLLREKEYEDVLKISELLLKDEHDLIHKALGWMLREIGKRDKEIEIKFLEKYHRVMPRTMLRYSIEKFNLKEKEKYMKKEA
ncbi:MAG TPA: DNA alkylation repair protein [Candidatus Pacearchaeota archaeon]|nr:DNA alkylation repair protein [Candidatus Pacearchaeota archaeon]HPR80002.1 DNA alkylation repair protein [Candidatus Pacearchaeota archaeon]